MVLSDDRDMMLPVTEIQRFSTQDGPGIRTTVFFKGCPLRCEWCHNPETQSSLPQIFFISQNCIGCGRCFDFCETGAHYIDTAGRHCFDISCCTGCLSCTDACSSNAIEAVGKSMSVSEITDVVLKDKVFYGDEGGITLSGGEPLLYFEGCLRILRISKENGFSTAVETSGCFDTSCIDELTELTDVFLWDFKDGNTNRHMQYTGVPNEKIIENLLLVDKRAKNIIMRCIMVKGVNMDGENFRKIANTFHSLKNCSGVELIPYHAYGGSKNEHLGYCNNGRKDWIPSPDDMNASEKALHSLGCKVITK